MVTNLSIASDTLIVKITNYGYVINEGQLLEAFNSFTIALNSESATEAVLLTHVCVDPTQLIKVMSLLSKKGYTTVSLKSIGTKSDREC